MIVTDTNQILLDADDSERLSKLIEWATQFVTSIDHITVQEAAQFIRDLKRARADRDRLAEILTGTEWWKIWLHALPSNSAERDLSKPFSVGENTEQRL